MGDVIIRIKGKPASYGDSWEEGNYQVYGSVEIKDDAGAIHVIENLAVKKSIAVDFNASMSAVQIVDGSKIGTFLGRNYVCAIQDKKGNVVTDTWPLQMGYRANRFVALGLTFLVPLTVIAPWFYIKASKLKKALGDVGAFEPINSNFISPSKKKKI